MADIVEQNRKEHYFADIARLTKESAPDWIRELRNTGAAAFSAAAFPHYKEEAWRFTNVKPVVETPFRSVVGAPSREITPDDVAPHLYDTGGPQFVFVDGFFSRALSRIPESGGPVTAGSLAEAFRENGSAIRNHLDKVTTSLNAFVPLNTAFLQDGAYCSVPDGYACETPIHFVYIATGAQDHAVYPRNLFIAGASSQVSIIESYVCIAAAKDSRYFSNAVTEFVVGDNARVDFMKIVEEGDAAYHLETATVDMGRDARFYSFTITFTGQIVRNELRVRLGAEGGHTELDGLYLNDRDRLIDNALHVEHAAPSCYSRMGYKGVLDGTSSSVFTGKVLVPRHSQKTDSDQLNNNLLLSDKATIDTKPQLEIFADDVKCTHGATIGGFPRELIFYFQSRGMTAEMAQAILTYGFASGVVDEIPVEVVRDRLASYVFGKYSPN